MRKTLLFLTLALVGLVARAQEPVFDYTNPTLDQIFSLAKGNTDEGRAYKQYMIAAVNVGLKDTSFKVSSLDEIQSRLFLEEVTLEEGSFINSGYSRSQKVMKPSVGHYYHGFAWVYKIGTFSIILLKKNCANVLIVAPIRIKLPDPVKQPAKKEYTPPAYNPPSYTPTSYKAPAYVNFTPTRTTVKKNNTLLWVGLGAVAAGVITYFFLKGKNSGGPGGAPPTLETGGPGGAPLTGHRPAPVVINTGELVSLGNPYHNRQLQLGFSIGFHK